VVQSDFRTAGKLCPNDHYLSTYLGKCPLCDGEMEPVEDLVDEMVEEAIAQNAEVEHVFTHHDGFTEHGVGAVLRFTL
jgi:peptide subunit release factor 1 (eRF1)